MDREIFLALNQFNARNEVLDLFLTAAGMPILKSVPLVLGIWALWFLPGEQAARTDRRERVVGAILCTIPIMLVTRALASVLPYRPRPMHTEGLAVILRPNQSVEVLDG